MRNKRPRQHDEAHLQFIRGLPCLVCEDNTATEACHIRFSDCRAAKVNPGVGQKAARLLDSAALREMPPGAARRE